MGKNTNKKWADKKAGIYSDKKKERLAKKKGKKMARLQKRAERGNAMASAKLERIETREALDKLRANPMVSDSEVMQDLAKQTSTLGTIAGQGAFSNALTGPEGPDAGVMEAQVAGIANPVAGAIAQTTDTKNKLKMMQQQDLMNRLQRNRDQKAQENIATTQLALQGLQSGTGLVAGATGPTA